MVHHGNQNCSPEEASAVEALVEGILGSGATWVDRNGQQRPVTFEDIIIITPYNAQVFEIQRRVPGARVGTVDKFQGQEAPIAIYSTATSSCAEAPRGDGVSLQPESIECRNIARQMRMHHGGLSGTL